MSRLAEVDAWLGGLDDHLHHVPLLSRANAVRGLAGTRQAIRADLSAHVDGPFAPHTVFIASSTVFTVALEWCAVLLARGGRVTLKSPRLLHDWYAAIASSTSLPLEATTDRTVMHRADRVVLMGSDATAASVRQALEHPDRLLAFGSRYSYAWWTEPDSAAAVALDTRLYDGRGCMSPAAVYSPLDDAPDRLAAALADLEHSLPAGVVLPSEAAWIRQRRALAKVVGRVVGDRVLALPARFASPRPTPGVATVHWVAEHSHTPNSPDQLSVVGSDGTAWPEVRSTPLGSMQLPPLDRLHDGVRWLDAL